MEDEYYLVSFGDNGSVSFHPSVESVGVLWSDTPASRGLSWSVAQDMKNDLATIPSVFTTLDVVSKESAFELADLNAL